MPKKSFYTKAYERMPWQCAGIRELTLEEFGLLYILCHGPYNGKSIANLTIGIAFVFPEELAGRFSLPLADVKRALESLRRKQWAVSDLPRGLIVCPPMVPAADNASHFSGFINLARKKLPDSKVAHAYIRLVASRTAEASASWGSDREVFGELIKDLQRSFPSIPFDSVNPSLRTGCQPPSGTHLDLDPDLDPDTRKGSSLKKEWGEVENE